MASDPQKPGGNKNSEPGGSQERESEPTATPSNHDRGEVVAIGTQEALVAVDNCSGPWPGFPSCELKMQVSISSQPES